MSFYQMHRGWMDNKLFDDEPYTKAQAWEWMIGEAQWKDGIVPVLGNPVMLRRGQFSDSIRFMAGKFKWSVSKVRCFISKLEKFEMIAAEHSTGQLIITICKYEEYQTTQHTKPHSSSTGTAQEPHKQEEIQEIQEKILFVSLESETPITPEIKPEKQKSKRLEPYLLATHQSNDIPQAWGDWAHEELRLSVEDINWEWEKFRDWWAAASGQKGVKADWFATWRNWMRKKQEDKTRKEKLNELYTQKRY